MTDVLDLIRSRHSSRGPYDPRRGIPGAAVEQMLEAARWSPTAHNMQNFEMLVIDDAAMLGKIGAIKTEISATFLRENHAQLSFSEAELRTKGTGLLAAMVPSSWQKPDATPESVRDPNRASLSATMQGCPLLLIVLYDSRKRAPASEGDVLGIMSLGCVMQNMWLVAQSLEIGLQIMSTFASPEPEAALRELLGIPAHMKIAFACRLGYPLGDKPYLRVRREARAFAHRNRF